MLNLNSGHIETYVKTGILTNEAYDELKEVALHYISRKEYHRYLNIEKEHLACDLVSYSIEKLATYDASRKKPVMAYLGVCIMNHIKNLVRDAFWPKRRGNMVFIDDRERDKGSILECHSFELSKGIDTRISDDKHFVMFCLSYWKANAHKYFEGTRLKVVNVILDNIISGRAYPKNIQETLVNEVRCPRHYVRQVLQLMKSTNQALYQRWVKGDTNV